MRKMIYGKERLCVVLDKGTYKGYKYAIVSYGTHPCCYVFIPKGHRFYKQSYEKIDIDCHGGLTFSSNDLIFNPIENNNDWVIGWDYAHYDDYMGYYEFDCLKDCESFSHSKKWTTEELLDEVKSVINQIRIDD